MECGQHRLVAAHSARVPRVAKGRQPLVGLSKVAIRRSCRSSSVGRALAVAESYEKGSPVFLFLHLEGLLSQSVADSAIEHGIFVCDPHALACALCGGLLCQNLPCSRHHIGYGSPDRGGVVNAHSATRQTAIASVGLHIASVDRPDRQRQQRRGCQQQPGQLARSAAGHGGVRFGFSSHPVREHSALAGTAARRGTPARRPVPASGQSLRRRP